MRDVRKWRFPGRRANALIVIIIPWDEVHFHVDFRNAEGGRVDVGHEEQHGYYLPSNGAPSVKVSLRWESAKSYYSNHKIRVITAKDASPKR
jgi:hypothetical protein